jgi:hypothetical protein
MSRMSGPAALPRAGLIGLAGFLGLAAIATPSSCTCQREENIEAKARLSKPAPPDPHVTAADDKIDAADLGNPETMKRVMRMEGQEIAARLKSFSMTSNASLSFGRGAAEAAGKVRSSEKTRMVQGLPQPDGASGDFAVEVLTGDGSEMRLAYVNDIFFLKNQNGRWRMSRDPQGERNAYRSESLAVWRSFYDLVAHALVVERSGGGTHAGRSVVKYRLALADTSAEARAAGAGLPPPPVGPDGGPPEESNEQRLTRVRERMSAWRERARPAGGRGELWVDEATGVVLQVKFTGAMVVGDGPDPARLDVTIDQTFSEIGKDHKVPMPKEAIEEVTRKKMPVRPRELLEEDHIVEPIADAGPAGVRAKKKPPPKPEVPDSDED